MPGSSFCQVLRDGGRADRPTVLAAVAFAQGADAIAWRMPFRFVVPRVAIVYLGRESFGLCAAHYYRGRI